MAGAPERGAVPCAVCGSQSFRRVLDSYPRGYPDGLRRYERCRTCAVVREDPQTFRNLEFDSSIPVSELSDADRSAFHDLYGESIQVVAASGDLYSIYDYDDTSEMVESLFQRVRRNIIAAQVQPEGMRYLEIGCADGFLLREVERRLDPESAVGIDPSPVSHAQAQRAGTLTMLGAVGDFELDDIGPFDVAVALGNLMLHTDPADTVRAVAGSLAPGGVFVFDVKNLDCSTRRLAIALAATPLRRIGPVRAFITRNFTNLRYAFGRTHLVRIVEDAGLTIEAVVSRPPRALSYRNAHAGSNGVAGSIWRALDRIDQRRGDQAWLEVRARKPFTGAERTDQITLDAAS